MSKNQGSIIELIVRKRGYNISDLANKLGISRRSVYNYFQSDTLKPSVIQNIGEIIKHDFSREFPELFTPEHFQIKREPETNIHAENQASAELDLYKIKYIELLEKYNNFLLRKLEYRPKAINY